MKIFIFVVMALCAAGAAFGEPAPDNLIKAEAYLAKERFAEAIEIYQELIERGETNPKIFSGLALCLDSLGQYPPALEAAQKAVSLGDKDAESYLRRGVIYGHMQDSANAAADFKKALSFDPLLAEAHFNLGIFYFREGNLKEAHRHYRQFLKVHPGAATVKFLQVTQEINRREHLREIEACEAILARNPKDPRAYVSLGTVLGEIGEYEKALRFLQLANAAAPQYAKSYYNRGVILRRAQQMPQANEAYKKAVSLDPKYTAAVPSGQFDYEMPCRRRILAYQYYVGFGDVYYHLGRLDCQLGDRADFEKQLHKLEEIGRYDDIQDLVQCQNSAGALQ